MVTDGNHTCGEPSIMYRELEPLYYTPETNVTLYVNYSQNIKKKKEEEDDDGSDKVGSSGSV